MKQAVRDTSKFVLVVVTMIFVAFLLQSCGQKGDLILPDDAAKKAEQEKKKKERLF